MGASSDGPTVQWAQADRAVFKELVLAGDLRGAAAFLERRTLSLLADGGAGSVQDGVAELAPYSRTLLLRLTAAEAGVRLRSRGTGLLPASPAELHPWTDTLLNTFNDWQAEQVPRALAQAFDRVRGPEGARPALELGTVVDLLSPAATSYRQLRSSLRGAVDRLGDSAEAQEYGTLWSGFGAFLWSSFTTDDFAATLPAAAASADRLAEQGSGYEGWVRAGAAYISVIGGELELAQRHIEAVDRFVERRPDDAPPPMRLLAQYAGALMTLWTNLDVAAFDALDRVISNFRRWTPGLAMAAQAEAASVLLDGNLPEAAKGYIERVRLAEPLTGQVLAERAAFLVTGDPAVLGRMQVLLDVLHGSSWGRRVGIARLRLARDLRLHGFTAEAAEARAEALRDLGPPEGLTRWESLLLAVADEARPGDLGRTVETVAGGLPMVPSEPLPPEEQVGGRIEVLRPALRVHRHGRVVDLPPLPTRLLAVLVAERGPVTVDRLVDLLWPGEGIAEGRLKVANAVYRLRRALDLAKDELVVRHGDVAELRPGPHWTVDAWEFWAGSRGATEERRAALALYTADLCEQQLAYDDALQEGRERFAARWIDLAIQLLAEDPRAADPVLVAQRAERIGASSPALVSRLARALVAAGRMAEARALVPPGESASPGRR